MKAKVKRRFKEKTHNDHIYQKGDVYPAYGFKADPDRVSFLADSHPELGHVYLEIDEAELKKKADAEEKAKKAADAKAKKAAESKSDNKSEVNEGVEKKE